MLLLSNRVAILTYGLCVSHIVSYWNTDYEKEDNSAKRGLELDTIHTTVNASGVRVQTTMKEQIRWPNNEQAYNDVSQQTKDHIILYQTDSSKRKIMSIQRNVNNVL